MESPAILMRAIKHRSNYRPIIFCSISLVGVGALMVILGVVILIVDYSEMGPPTFDAQYERYQGSSLSQVLGPLFMAFGSLIIIGNLLLLAYATKSYYQNDYHHQNSSPGDSNHSRYS